MKRRLLLGLVLLGVCLLVWGLIVRGCGPTLEDKINSTPPKKPTNKPVGGRGSG